MYCTYTKKTSDGYYTTWKTECGNKFRVVAPDDIGICFAPLPTEGGKLYCPYCGKKVAYKEKYIFG